VTGLVALRDAVAAQVAKVIVGQEAALDVLLAALSVGGHVLLEGVPGTGKTLLADATARALGLDFRRMQFTPDMLPSDITGTMTLRGGELTFRPGPVFTNLLLADEVNRTPPKTQAALLEAMQARPARCPTPSSWWPPRTPSSTRAPTRCPRPSSTASS
jgi:MoxR-like ATPase